MNKTRSHMTVFSPIIATISKIIYNDGHYKNWFGCKLNNRGIIFLVTSWMDDFGYFDLV